MLKDNDDNSPIKAVVDGPPGAGKTTLCRKLCNVWAKNELVKCSFDFVFLLRDERVSSPENVSDLISIFHSCEEICEPICKKIKKEIIHTGYYSMKRITELYNDYFMYICLNKSP